MTVFLYDRGGVPLEDLLAKAWEARGRNFPSVIRFDYPNRTLSVTTTGRECGLNCAHCGGHYLEAMTPIEEALRAAQEGAGARVSDGGEEDTTVASGAGAAVTTTATAEASGAAAGKGPSREPTSYLISGGCTRVGTVPFKKWLPAIEALKTAGKLNFHVGLVDEEDAQIVGRLADSVSFDMVGDDATIHEVFGLKDRTVGDYVNSYRALRRHTKVLPHICLGLRGGIWSGEEQALQILQQEGLDGLVFIVFIPTPGTRYADRRPLPVEEVASFLAQARVQFPDKPIFLGCMRPGGSYRQKVDQLAVRAGLNALVQPARPAVNLAAELGLKIERGEECCVL